jgi:hypothetical protein
MIVFTVLKFTFGLLEATLEIRARRPSGYLRLALVAGELLLVWGLSALA